jgi:predicted ribosome quality control (RQC) complex YloA/Tae2 family protein
LAKELGLTEYPAPAGGCLLTDKGYSKRLQDLFEHQETTTAAELHLLKYGRHFRISEETKFIAGRTKSDNEKIIKYHDPSKDTLIKVRRIPGPVLLIPYGADEASVHLAASVCIGYSKADTDTIQEVKVVTAEGEKTIKVKGVSPGEVKKYMI